MTSRSLISFIAGLILGAMLLLAIQQAPRSLHWNPFESQAEIVQDSVPGLWQGNVQVAGYDVGFSLLFKKSGSGLTADLTAGPIGVLPCDNVKIDAAGNISFSVRAQDHSATFTGKLAPATHSMAGTLNGDAGSGSWSVVKKPS
jgi:hypothetical protein